MITENSKVCFTEEAFRLIPSIATQSIFTVVKVEQIQGKKERENNDFLTIATLGNGTFCNVYWLKLI